MMKELSDLEMKQIQIDMMAEIHEFCEKHSLKYFLYAGSLIGAIRHNGFIPWDDDIDIAMPRKDYEIFCKTFGSDRYNVYSCENNANFFLPYAKVYDKTTVKVENCYYKNITLGVDIDIFPIDDLGEGGISRKELLQRKKLIKKHHLAIFRFTKTNNIVKFAYRLLKQIYVSIVRLLGGLNANKIVRQISNKAKTFAGENNKPFLYADTNVWQPLLMESEWIENIELHKFEDKQFYIPTGYDGLLTKIYGDYMTPPPEDKRITHHLFKAYKRG